MRTSYLASGLTLNELSGRVRFAKSKISELLRGVGLYPRWEIVLLLATELGMPNWPLYRLWSQAALEAHKSSEWINSCTDRTTVTATHTTPPLDHGAFRELVENDYVLYAQVFLDDDQRDNAVADTFDRLWLSWNQALASHDLRRYAWNVLRTTVMARTPHRDGRPELGHAAFDTVTLQNLTDPAHYAHQLSETLELFTVISRLPDRQLDVIVLRRLCGFTHEAASALLGTSLATIRSDERHATRFLDSVIPPPSTEGTAP
ncbi:sigma-70 family RNA polymerase sigma factor [Streptomyces sp. SID7958]|uniref:Sigma-70 family RNA polymerase sigma factor n=3 Tax=Streptomyces TaxID=1883 RepID=A0A6G3QTI2_9ACTN|nr:MULTISPECIES: sigma-70 family RNA polymerase sigma factor [unclassified Streptomyces]NEA86642.1 sigma-70 family RNA polymerase sigma factor [Streptomyces sp. SID14436]NEC81083.1 sigma-70 family RNA polymerase sigma factor [Streptomyces sp. SID7958]